MQNQIIQAFLTFAKKLEPEKTFAVNEQKVFLFARSPTKNAIFGTFSTNFPPPPKDIFSKNKLKGPVHLKDELSFWDELFRPQDKFSGLIFVLRTK